MLFKVIPNLTLSIPAYVIMAHIINLAIYKLSSLEKIGGLEDAIQQIHYSLRMRLKVFRETGLCSESGIS